MKAVHAPGCPRWRMPLFGHAGRPARAMEAAAPRPLPVIALTAAVSPGDAGDSHDVGISDRLAKPVESAALDAVLRKWLAEVASAS